MFGAGTKADTGLGGRTTGPHVGAILSQTRQSLGQSIADVARDLRIRRTFLEAIEGARYADLPGPAYTLGFIRTYAEHLGLEGDEIVRRFKAESGQVAPKSKLNFPSPMTESTAPKAAVLLIGAVIALVAYGIWYLSSNRYLDVAELVLPLPEHLRKILPGDERSVDVPIALPTPQPGTAAPSTADAPPAYGGSETPPVAAQTPSPSPSPSPSEVNAAVTPPPPAVAPASSAPLPSATAGEATAGDVPSRIVLKANSDTWVEVRSSSPRATLLSRLMRAGETFAVPDRPGLTLMTGNAGGLEVVVDGEGLPPLGRPGAVRRAVPLDAEQLKAAATAAN